MFYTQPYISPFARYSLRPYGEQFSVYDSKTCATISNTTLLIAKRALNIQSLDSTFDKDTATKILVYLREKAIHEDCQGHSW
jgi:hypothetical protein